MRRRTSIGLALAAVAWLGLAAAGQEAPVRQIRLSPAAARAARLPYTAEFKTTRVQTLSDGSTVTHESTEVVARDSQGRSLNSTTRGAGSEFEVEQTSVTVFDPVARTTTFWFTPGRRVTVSQNPDANAAPASCPANNAMPRAMEARHEKPVAEDLGKQTFQGVEAQGHRTTTTYPAGAVGNSEPLAHSDEVWFSTTAGVSGINVRQVVDDPQTGRSTRELVKFTQGEPDASLFQPPQDFEVVNQETRSEVRCP